MASPLDIARQLIQEATASYVNPRMLEAQRIMQQNEAATQRQFVKERDTAQQTFQKTMAEDARKAQFDREDALSDKAVKSGYEALKLFKVMEVDLERQANELLSSNPDIQADLDRITADVLRTSGQLEESELAKIFQNGQVNKTFLDSALNRLMSNKTTRETREAITDAIQAAHTGFMESKQFASKYADRQQLLLGIQRRLNDLSAQMYQLIERTPGLADMVPQVEKDVAERLKAVLSGQNKQASPTPEFPLPDVPEEQMAQPSVPPIMQQRTPAQVIQNAPVLSEEAARARGGVPPTFATASPSITQRTSPVSSQRSTTSQPMGMGGNISFGPGGIPAEFLNYFDGSNKPQGISAEESLSAVNRLMNEQDSRLGLAAVEQFIKGRNALSQVGQAALGQGVRAQKMAGDTSDMVLQSIIEKLIQSQNLMNQSGKSILQQGMGSVDLMSDMVGGDQSFMDNLRSLYNSKR